MRRMRRCSIHPHLDGWQTETETCCAFVKVTGVPVSCYFSTLHGDHRDRREPGLVVIAKQEATSNRFSEVMVTWQQHQPAAFVTKTTAYAGLRFS